MFVLQKQLSVLNVPSSRVAMLYRSGADIQLALPDLPSQLGSAFMVMLKGGGKVQVLVALHMAKSCRNIFYVSDSGEVAAERAERELEEGQVFAESMGFILNDSEFSRIPVSQQEAYWKSLPICQRQVDPTTKVMVPEKKNEVVLMPVPAPVKNDLETKRQILKVQLGKLLASL